MVLHSRTNINNNYVLNIPDSWKRLRPPPLPINPHWLVTISSCYHKSQREKGSNLLKSKQGLHWVCMECGQQQGGRGEMNKRVTRKPEVETEGLRK